jgi:adenylate kinase family enzyme
MPDYYHKYIKYKAKYLQLKYPKMIGGNKLVIHISGPSGSGKSTLGNKLKKEFGKKIVVKDVDDLQLEFIKIEYGNNEIKKFNANKYQKWIDDFVAKQIKPLVFVGLNHMYWWHKDLYYDMHSNYNFYIDIDSDIIFKQKCSRMMDNVFVDYREQLLKNMIKNENKTLKHIQLMLEGECGYKFIKKLNNMWYKDYKKQNYKFMSREKIFEKVKKILNVNQ